MQHAAIVQDNVTLVETVAVEFWFLENLPAPCANRLGYFSTKSFNRYSVNERCRIRPRESDRVLTHNTTNDRCVAVIGLYQGLTSVIEIPQRRSSLMVVAEDRRREIRALQVLGPLAEVVNMSVYRLQC